MSDSVSELPWPASIKRGDANRPLAEAFQELRAPLLRYLHSLGVSEAEELVQETFLRLCQRAAEAPDAGNLRAWVFRVAHNLARDQQRERVRRPQEPLVAVADGRRNPEAEFLARERELRLRAALARLPECQQHALHLRAEGLRYREIAEVLGAPVSTVAGWVQQALSSLVEACHE